MMNPPNNEKRDFFIVLAAGLFVRIVALAIVHRYALSSDAADYQQAAMHLVRGEPLSPYWPPGLPYWIALVSIVFGPTEFVARCAMLPCYVVLTWLTYRLTRSISSHRAAIFAVALVAISPTMVHHSVEPLTQLPAATLLVGCLCFALLALRHGHVWLLVGFGFQLAALTLLRPSSIALVLLFSAVFWLKAPQSSYRLIRFVGIPVTIALVIIGLWNVHVYRQTGDWVFINYANARNFFLGNNPYTPPYRTWWLASHGDEEGPRQFRDLVKKLNSMPLKQRDQRYRKLALDHIRQNPIDFIRRTINRMRCYFAFDTFSGSFLMTFYQWPKLAGLTVIALDGLFYLLCSILSIAFVISQPTAQLWRSKAMVLFVASTLGYAGPYWISFSHPTYHFPILPLLVIGASMMLAAPTETWNALLDSLRGSGWKRRFAIAIAVVFAYVQIEWLYVMSKRL